MRRGEGETEGERADEGILREEQALINERLLYRPETILIPTIFSFKSLTLYPSDSLIGFLIGAICATLNHPPDFCVLLPSPCIFIFIVAFDELDFPLLVNSSYIRNFR